MRKSLLLSISNFLLLLVARSWIGQTYASSYSGCSQGRQRVVSYDNALISPSNISASSQETVFNPDDYLFHRNNIPLRLWCTDVLEGGTQNLSGEVHLADLLRNTGTHITINVTFTTPLLLTHILTSGFSNGYVKSFTIQQSLEVEGPFLPYSSSGGVQSFEASHLDTVFSLDPPIAARKIRFDIQDGVMTPSAQLCWHLTVLGCTLNEATPQTPEVPQNQSQSSLIPQCTVVGIIPTTSSSVPSPTSTSCIMTTVTETVTATTTISSTPSSTSWPMTAVTDTSSIADALPHISPSSTFSSSSSDLPSACSFTVTHTAAVATVPCYILSTESSSPDVTGSPTPTPGSPTPTPHTNGSDDATAKSCQRYRLVLYVVPSVAVGMLLLACLSFACICACMHCRCKVERRDFGKGGSGTMLDNELYESREQVRHYPKEGEDTLGMIDNELYKTRGSVLPSALLRARQIPTQINSSNINGIPSGSANGAANRSNAVMYENCGRFFPGSKRSTFTDSMNPRSTGTTDIEQSTKSVDSMVDNPTYCVPFPVDYHEVSIYPQKKPHPPVFPMNSLTKGVSSIDMVDNECYCVPSSLSGRDDMEQSLVAGQQFPPLEYETPK